MIGKIPVIIAVINGIEATEIQFYMEIEPEQILMRHTDRTWQPTCWHFMLRLWTHRLRSFRSGADNFFTCPNILITSETGPGHFYDRNKFKDKEPKLYNNNTCGIYKLLLLYYCLKSIC